MGQCEKRGHAAGAVRAGAGHPSNRSPIMGAVQLRLAAKARNGRLGKACRARPTLPPMLLNLLPGTCAQKASSWQDETEQPAGRERVPEGGQLSTGCAHVRTTQGRVCGGVRGARRPAASGARVKPPATLAPVFQMQTRSHRLIGPATLRTSLASAVLQECPVAG